MNPTSTRPNDKRTRLVDAAATLFQQKGVSTSTLANIAALADVPLGNVYYYFKSKDSIIGAVIEQKQKSLQKQFTELSQIEDSKTKLKSFVELALRVNENQPTLLEGIGSLCQELNKQEGDIASYSSRLIHEVLNWCQKQFEALGKHDTAKKLALSFVAQLQGISLLINTLKDNEILIQHQALINEWLDAV
ncbi:MAG: TetR family transcriptional regulator [Francisellaceae bacterium]|nr:TetR family transcriptional regulator [Francisellaceae bacterium]